MKRKTILVTIAATIATVIVLGLAACSDFSRCTGSKTSDKDTRPEFEQVDMENTIMRLIVFSSGGGVNTGIERTYSFVIYKGLVLESSNGIRTSSNIYDEHFWMSAGNKHRKQLSEQEAESLFKLADQLDAVVTLDELDSISESLLDAEVVAMLYDDRLYGSIYGPEDLEFEFGNDILTKMVGILVDLSPPGVDFSAFVQLDVPEPTPEPWTLD